MALAVKHQEGNMRHKTKPTTGMKHSQHVDVYRYKKVQT
jgi:hypothetical protein